MKQEPEFFYPVGEAKMIRIPSFSLFTLFTLFLLPQIGAAQPNCRKGIPCGNSCISASKVCRIGSPNPAAPTTSPPTTPTQSTGTTKKSEESEKSTKVWINTKSKVYHCPGTRYFGATANGRYSTEKEAIADGNRAAYGRSCGS